MPHRWNSIIVCFTMPTVGRSWECLSSFAISSFFLRVSFLGKVHIHVYSSSSKERTLRKCYSRLHLLYSSMHLIGVGDLSCGSGTEGGVRYARSMMTMMMFFLLNTLPRRFDKTGLSRSSGLAIYPDSNT